MGKYVKCPTCNGTGKEICNCGACEGMFDCPDCGGSKNIPDDHIVYLKFIKNGEILNEIKPKETEKDKPKYTFIKCAAIKYNDIVISGYRHDDCFRNLYALKKYDEINKSECIQGFIDLANNFWTREEAAEIAFKHDQIDKEVSKLYSEDLY